MSATERIPRLITVGVLAAKLGQPIHRVLHILATRDHIIPAARAGNLRVYNEQTVALVRHELNSIDARRNNGSTVRIHT